jgi:hypothetical protein
MFRWNSKKKVIQFSKEFQVSENLNDCHEIDFREKRKISQPKELKFLKDKIQETKEKRNCLVVDASFTGTSL